MLGMGLPMPMLNQRQSGSVIVPMPLFGTSGFRQFGGRMATGAERFDNTTQKTFQVTAECPAPSYAFVRPIIANGDSSAGFDIGGMSIASLASASDLNGGSATHVQVMMDGSPTGSIAASSGSTSFRRSYKLGDRTELASVARTDGGTKPLLLMRCYISTSGSISTLGNGVQSFTNWASRTDGNLWAMRYNDGNCCEGTGTPGDFVSVTNVSQCPIVGFVFETANGEQVCTVVGQGDSITEGQGTYVGAGFGLPACNQLSELYPDVTFSWANSGWSGSGMDSFQPRNTDMFSAGLVPDLTIFPNGSPNTSPPIISATITNYTTYLTALIYQASLYGVRSAAWTWLPTDPAVKDWGSSDSLRVAWNATVLARDDIKTSDFSTALSGATDGDGQVLPLNMPDGIHPNDAGNEILASLCQTVIISSLGQWFGYQQVTGGYDPLAVILFNSFSNPASDSRKLLYNNWYLSMRAGDTTIPGGMVTKFDAAYLFAAVDEDSARKNLINPGANTVTLVGSPTFTSDRGYQGNGVDTKLDTNLKASSSTIFQQNSAAVSLWSRTAAQGATSTDFGNSNSVAVLRNGSNQFLGRLNAVTNVTIAGVTDASGMFTLSRTASDLTTIYRNASSIGTSAVVSGPVDASNNICLFGRGGSAAFSARQGAYGSIRGGASGSDVTAEYDATLTYLQAVGAA